MKNITNFTQENALTLFNSADDFPVDFDLAWRWLGFSRKDTAKESLTEGIFEEGRDFLYSRNDPGIEKINAKTAKSINKKAGQQQEIWLTVDCFKTWGMMAATERGREVRKYFLECERKLKEVTAIAAAQSKPRSLMDLSCSQLYRLFTYLDAVESGLEVDTEVVEGIDPIFLNVAWEAASLAYSRRLAKESASELVAHDLTRQMYEGQMYGEGEKERAEDVAKVAAVRQRVGDLEATDGYLYAFEVAESVVSGRLSPAAGVLALEPGETKVYVFRSGVALSQQIFSALDLPVGEWVWVSRIDVDTIKWRDASGERSGVAACVQWLTEIREELKLAIAQRKLLS